MLTKVLRNYTIQKNLSKNYREQKSLRPNLDDIKEVVFLVDANKVPHSELLKAKEVLTNLGMRTTCVAFSDRVQDTIHNVFQLHEKSFRYRSQLRKEVKDKVFFTRDYDMVICFNPNNHPFVHLILTELKATLRLGCEPAESSLYDIVVNVGNDRNIVRFVQQSILLLQNLNKR